MPLRYMQSNRHSKKRIATWIGAVLALLLALAILGGWMLWFYLQSAPTASDDDADSPPQYEDPLTETNCSLVIFDFDDTKQFILIQSAPADNAIRIMDVPGNLTDNSGNTLVALLSKHGSMSVVQAVSSALDLSIAHHITWSTDGVRSFLENLDRGITYTLPESMQYTDKNGATIRLSEGEQQLTGTQIAAVLQNNAWTSADVRKTTASNVIAAILNQYILPQRNLDGYFSALADTAQTDLRIDNYNAFRRTLTHLGDHNTGALCCIITLIGTEENGHFTPDLSAMRQQTELYS